MTDAVTTVEVEWRDRIYRLTVIDAKRHRAFWQEPGSPVKRHPSEMPRGLCRAWRNQAAQEAPQGA